MERVEDGWLRRDSAAGRGALTAVTLGSAVALLDGTVVNIAVRTIGADLGASLAQLQWVLNGYVLSLASLVLVGGAIGDRVGRRRAYLVGVGWFAAASALCALAPSPGMLVAFRVLQGVGAALLTPGALAVIHASFRPADRGAAIGTWAGTSGIAAAVGPFLGGWIIDVAGWRWVFAINLPLCVAVILLTLRCVPETRDAGATGRFDLPGAGLAVVVLGVLTWAFTAAGGGWTPLVVAGLAVALVAGAGFVVRERRARHPLVPLGLFASRVFSAANVMTFLVYGALGAVLFLLVLQLQVTAGFSPLGSGLATIPITVTMLLLSPRFAALSGRSGPRTLMALGPVLCGAGVLLLAGVDARSAYWTGIYPGLQLFAVGLAMLVSPLTATVLAATPDRYAGVASGINNAVARAGSLLAVAALPAAVGLSGADYADPTALTAGYRLALFACAALLVVGGVVSWFGIAPGPVDAPGAGAPPSAFEERGREEPGGLAVPEPGAQEHGVGRPRHRPVPDVGAADGHPLGHRGGRPRARDPVEGPVHEQYPQSRAAERPVGPLDPRGEGDEGGDVGGLGEVKRDPSPHRVAEEGDGEAGVAGADRGEGALGVPDG